MSLGEFSLIQKFFSQHEAGAKYYVPALGIGDDGAVLDVPSGYQLVQTIDTLISGQHFPEDTAAADIGYKSLAVNVSDLLAMAADPAWFVLSLSLPNNDATWLQDFSTGLFQAADDYSIRLVGGDTCKGSLSITIQASGLVPDNRFVTRHGAEVGDRIFVTGQLGSAALALAALEGRLALSSSQLKNCLPALNRPRPVLALIPILRQFASAAIDISDGLSSDLGHILEQSQVGAQLIKQQLPVLPWIQEQDRYDLALHGGDDYQLLFTVDSTKVEAMKQMAEDADVIINEIGEITAYDFELIDGHQSSNLQTRGFDHFG